MHVRTAKPLHDALTAAEYIQAFIAERRFVGCLDDVYFRSAVERQFEILSEALRAASSRQPELNDLFPELRAIVGFGITLLTAMMRSMKRHSGISLLSKFLCCCREFVRCWTMKSCWMNDLQWYWGHSIQSA